MNIDEAIKVMNTFVAAYEHAQKTEFVDKLLHVKSDYEATKVVLREYHKLVKEVSNLAIESVKREKELAKLEAEVLYMQTKYKKFKKIDIL